MLMDESVDMPNESQVDESCGDVDVVELESISAAAAPSDPPDDVTDVSGCDDSVVWNGRDGQLDVGDGAGLTSADAERLRTELQHQFDVIAALNQEEMDDADDLQELELERAFRARDELLQSLAAGILRDIEQDNFQEAELAIDMWMEVLGMRPWKTDDRPPAQECHVCLELVKVDKRPCCGLPVCQDCMKKYVETQMREAGVVRIGCPNSACGRFISQEEVREMLKYMPELRDRYDRWLVDLNADPQRKTCPRCCRITEIEALDRRTAGKYGVLINCPDCELNWCFPCQAPWHEGVTCAKNKAGDELLKRWARQRKTANEYNAQRCPKCKVRVTVYFNTAVSYII